MFQGTRRVSGVSTFRQLHSSQWNVDKAEGDSGAADCSQGAGIYAPA